MSEAADITTFDMPARHDYGEDCEIGRTVRVREVDGDDPCLAVDPTGDCTILKREKHPDKSDWLRFTLRKIR